MFNITFFQIIMLCVGIITNRAAKFQFSDGTPVLSTDPASVIIRLGLLPLGHIQLVMLHYEHSEYSPFNTRLFPVTHGITICCQLVFWVLIYTRHFQHPPRFELLHHWLLKSVLLSLLTFWYHCNPRVLLKSCKGSFYFK